MGGGVAVAMRHVADKTAEMWRDNLATLRNRPARRPDWAPYAANLEPPHINPMWQGQINGPDPLDELPHQAPAWHHALAPQAARPAPVAAWFPVQHPPQPAVPIVPKLHHMAAPPIAQPVAHVVLHVQPGAGPRPQVPLPPNGHALQVAPPLGPPPVQPGPGAPGPGAPDPNAARNAARRAKYAADMELAHPGKAAATVIAKKAAALAKTAKAAATLVKQDAVAEKKALATAAYAAKHPAKAQAKADAYEAKYPGKSAAELAARQARAKPKGGARAKGGSRPRRAKLKINDSNLLMPFHDITDDPYFIRV